MAQLLIKAQEPWNNASADAPPERSRLGDIIVVRDDNHVWGKEECLPRFIVVKVPNVTYETAKKFEEALMGWIDDADHSKGQKMLKVRKWWVPSTYMSNAITAGNSVITITASPQQTAFINNILEKTS